ncbi:CorA metal ion transporter [Chytridiales sp. JEL 0842]|nr:CorA metal ion transporter [Chytridiales sp. JEL 0842]
MVSPTQDPTSSRIRRPSLSFVDPAMAAAASFSADFAGANAAAAAAAAAVQQAQIMMTNANQTYFPGIQGSQGSIQGTTGYSTPMDGSQAAFAGVVPRHSLQSLRTAGAGGTGSQGSLQGGGHQSVGSGSGGSYPLSSSLPPRTSAFMENNVNNRAPRTGTGSSSATGSPSTVKPLSDRHPDSTTPSLAGPQQTPPSQGQLREAASHTSLASSMSSISTNTAKPFTTDPTQQTINYAPLSDPFADPTTEPQPPRQRMQSLLSPVLQAEQVAAAQRASSTPGSPETSAALPKPVAAPRYTFQSATTASKDDSEHGRDDDSRPLLASQAAMGLGLTHAETRQSPSSDAPNEPTTSLQYSDSTTPMHIRRSRPNLFENEQRTYPEDNEHPMLTDSNRPSLTNRRNTLHPREPGERLQSSLSSYTHENDDGLPQTGTNHDAEDDDDQPTFQSHLALDIAGIADYLESHAPPVTSTQVLSVSIPTNNGNGTPTSQASTKGQNGNNNHKSSSSSVYGWRRTPRIYEPSFNLENGHAAPRFMFYSDTTGTLRSEYFEELDLRGVGMGVLEVLESGPFWLDVCNPSNEEMHMFTRVFGIHPLTTEDILTSDTREKCEVFPNYYFITIRSFDGDEYSMTYLHPINVYIVVFRECVLSFHMSPVAHPNNVLRRIDQLKVYGLNISPDWLNYALIDDITDSFMPILRFIELEVDSIDELVLILRESEQSDMLRRIGHSRKRVMLLNKLLITKADVLKAVIKRCAQKLAPNSETTLYLGDIQDHVITMLQTLNHADKTLSRSHSNYLAQISIEITQASNRTSEVVLRMTALASIVLPLNIITGLWGMNVKVPGQGQDDLIGFSTIVGSMALIALITFLIVKKLKLV